MKPKVVFKNVTKKYSLYAKKTDKILELILPNKKTKNFYALQDISFEVFEGETIGIVGINGSGKSTLSNLLAQVVSPTSGTIEMDGTPSLIAISAGLNNHLTGMENIELKCLMHGLSKKVIKELTPSIIEFAEIGDFINQPVKNYSSGMKSRLGFAISVHTNPDILVVDEALSVGDQTFYQKCIEKVDEFKKEGKTIFFISHSLSQMASISDRVMWMHYGKVKEFGDSSQVIKDYKEFINWFNKLSTNEKKEYKKSQLNEQSLGKTISNNSDYRRSRNGKKSSGLLFYLQTTIIIALFLVSSSFMFFNDPVKSIMSYVSDVTIKENRGDLSTNKPDNQIKTTELKNVDKQGIVQSKSAKLFDKVNQENEKLNLDFGTKVWIQKSNGDIHQILINNQSYYTNAENIGDNLKDTSNVQLNDFRPTFDSSLDQTYQYFLAFFGSDYSEIKDSLNGLTSESSDYLKYGYDGVTYHFNNNKIADEIIFDGIDLSQLDSPDLLNQAEIISSSKENYYFIGEKYDLVVSKENNTIKVILNQEGS
ncbi:teichoic acids export ABC transporter ATP-binding subunit TagH [Rossellomorea aquimaris]|jgi:teichoic acid transport system ATP-binding protein|uniref:teichoic acids export ABC transporter ATP-binding subunit TagH n=1 Tax=Rossellomorea aquimaris TaxID=189382 RepID=UPI0011E8F3C9|nr:teichoic acids export ABC transporter ATP-binding subunit TagH [Rossellomorea aquimaris]TYS85243.1 teichoic acids export ABC transporter ATP-binding subunit TagH [Rossellomorea aquimaris]